jgi:hypothetical protein
MMVSGEVPARNVAKNRTINPLARKWWVTMPAQILSPAASLGGGADTDFCMASR